MKTFMFTLIGMLAVSCSVAHGQTYSPSAAPSHALPPVVQVPVPAWMPYAHHASTVAEGQARGAAAVIVARGQYSLFTAQARMLAEEAERRELENRRLRLETTLKVREISRQYQAGRQAAVRTRTIRQASASQPRMDELFDTTTGRPLWPKALQLDYFAEDRQAIEQLLDRQSTGAPPTPDNTALRESAGRCLAHMNEHIREIPGMDYVAAKKFLDRLARPATQPNHSSSAVTAVESERGSKS